MITAGSPTKAREARMPPTSERRAAVHQRRLRVESGGAGDGSGRRPMATTAMIIAVATAAGSAVSQSGWSGPTNPTASSVPMTATAAKFVRLLSRKNATEGRAIVAASAPRDRVGAHAVAVQDPGADRKSAGTAGRDDRADAELRPGDLRRRAPR